MVSAARYVEAPAVKPLPYGLLDAAVVIPDPDPHIGFGTEWEPEFCGPAQTTVAACLDGDALDPTDGYDLVESHPFTVYHLFRCRLIGAYDRGAERAQQALRLGEGRAVEETFASLLTDAAAAASSADEALALDVTPTPGTAVDLVDGLAILEQYAGQNYGGSPLIHGPRDVASRLISRNSLAASNGVLMTGLGSKFSAGAGYEGWEPVYDVTAGDDETWLVATGTMVIRQSPMIETGPVPVLATPDNQFFALAERPENIGWECFAVAVLVRNSSAVLVDDQTVNGGAP